MSALYDQVSEHTSRLVTKQYSTSFSLATKMLGANIRRDVYNIYGFVRLSDEIVDTFLAYDNRALFDDFEAQLYRALDQQISLNPVLHAFQQTYHRNKIPLEYVKAFMNSMRADLDIKDYTSKEAYEQYIYGSADVVGLMCLCVFVQGDCDQFNYLKPAAMKLGSAFQKVNFLRDLKDDQEHLGRSYFPNTNLSQLDEASKQELIDEIEQDFAESYQGIKDLPVEARFGVLVAYRYYRQLLKSIKNTPAAQIKKKRIRVHNVKKMDLLFRSFVRYQLNLL